MTRPLTTLQAVKDAAVKKKAKKVPRLRQRLRAVAVAEQRREEERRIKRWMRDFGVPLIRKDLEALESRVKLAREKRNAVIYEAFEQAAKLADLAEQRQQAEHGSKNSGGAALTARVIRAWAHEFKRYQGDT